ncbi:C5a peptidase precursor ScpZ [Streptococcus dysgalactiae]|nr:C5a peptidase precursor ScpZ [Streptococcus dysgalactiae subsp. dysgalactiae]SUN50475.1 C5a peptidase precursor ScpZ [Streptococcus dysgalactiae]
MTMKNHSKKKIVCQLTLATTSLLLLNHHSVLADEQVTEETVLQANSAASPVVDEKTETSTIATNSETSSETEESGAAADEAKEEAPKADETISKEQEPIPAFAEKTESLPSQLSKNDLTKIQELQLKTDKGSGQIIAIIDDEFDPEHEVFKLDHRLQEYPNLLTKEKFSKIKEEQNISYGRWYNEKVIFTYDYSKETDEIFDPKASNVHGTHVAAIATGNGEKATENSLRMEGIAANASILMMKVKSGGQKDAFAISYAKAIQDAVKLGATVINMSFGKAADSLSDLHPDVKTAIIAAKNKGVLLVAASGNEGAIGMGSRLPLSSNPDFGTLNSPAISEDVISVAAANPMSIISQSLQVTIDDQSKSLPIFLSAHKSFDDKKQYTLVDAVFGEEGDFETVDAKNKVVLIQRGGSLNFSQKIENALKAGAAGVIISNNDALQGNFTIAHYFIPKGCSIPVGFISLKDSALLKKANNFMFNKAFEVFANNAGLRPISQSSWGVTAEGMIKPDIAAPGFNILSATEGKQYGYESGTSMATPHVSGILSLLQKAYKDRFPELTDNQRSQLIRTVVMSSATALYSPEEQAYFSPRHQGAGHIDAQKALKADYYLTDAAGQAKINLGNIQDKFVVTLNVKRLTKKQAPKTLYFQLNLGTDKTKDGHFELQPKGLQSSEWQAITITNDVEEIQIAVDASAYAADLLKEMPNGYFLEGFVRFTDNLDRQDELMSIPFSGFRGDFANLPALDTPIYDTLEAGAFYQKLEKDDETGKYLLPEKDSKVTALVSVATPYFLAQETKAGEINELGAEAGRNIILGTEALEGERDVIAPMAERIFQISPNGDGHKDSVLFQGIFLRNVKNIKAQVLDKNGKLVWESSSTATRKYFQDLDESAKVMHRFENTKWDGQTSDDETVEDGLYIYRVLYTPVAEGAKAQIQDFKVEVKTSLPELPTKASYDTETGKFSIDVSQLPEGVRFQIGYNTEIPAEVEEGEEPYNDQVVHYIPMQADGSFDIPKTIETELSEKPLTVDFSKLVLIAEDRFGNYHAVSLEKLLPKGQSDQPTENEDVEKESFQPMTNEEEQSSEASTDPEMTDKQLKEFIDRMIDDANLLILTETKSDQPKVLAPQGLDEKENADTFHHNMEIQSSSAKVLPKTAERSNLSLLAGLGLLCSTVFVALFKKKEKQ